MATNWMQDVTAAFLDEGLRKRILFAGERGGDQTLLPQLFQDISRYVLAQRAQSNHSIDGQVNAKKRKLEDESHRNNHVVPKPVSQTTTGTPFFECKDVSVQVPARKKMKVELLGDAASKTHQINLSNPTTSEIEHALPAAEVDEVFCLPVPDKQQRQMNFAIFPKPGALDGMGRPAEQVLFVMNETSPMGLRVDGDTILEDDTYVTITHRALDRWLSAYGKRVVTPNAAHFASSIVQSHRKNEKAYHVKAHRGSKEGYLFFLENGIVFGFKKPLAFFPFHTIESISYTSVLQRTFNLVIATLDSADTPAKEIEFGMIDQEDFAGIDAYVKRHGLSDASMAAQRQAKAYNVNKEKKAEVNGDAGGVEDDDGQTELQRAEQQLQDEEDELEEDYEVSGGESEGEGEDSEEEGEGYEDEEVEGEGEYEDEEGEE